MRAQFVLGLLFIAATFGVGCGRCAAVSSTELRPGDEITLHLNEVTTAEYWRTGRCGYPPTTPTRVALRWSTADTLVVRVDSLSGVTRAIGLGDAQVWGYSSDVPATPITEILVHVR
jgi:hypothetical protein